MAENFFWTFLLLLSFSAGIAYAIGVENNLSNKENDSITVFFCFCSLIFGFFSIVSGIAWIWS